MTRVLAEVNSTSALKRSCPALASARRSPPPNALKRGAELAQVIGRDVTMIVNRGSGVMTPFTADA